MDGSVFDAAPEVSRIDLQEIGPFTVITWASVAAASGLGTQHEIAGAALASLTGPGPAAPPCIATGVAVPVFAMWSTSPNEFFLVRAVTPCGPGPGRNWGADSAGRPIIACP